MSIRARWAVALVVATAVYVVTDLFVAVDLMGSIGEGFDRGVGRRIFVLAFFLSLGTVTAWLIWQHGAHKRLQMLGVSGLQFTPGWAVGWWFIPFANLFKPHQAMQELWKASQPGSTGEGWKQAKAHTLVGVWWWVFLISRFLGGFTGGAARGAGSSDELKLALMFAIPVDLLTIAAAVLAVGLIASIEERLRYREQIPTGAAPAPDLAAS
ncbi:MAG: DUF4328 domain-containing protein [Actinomycetota bacterium]